MALSNGMESRPTRQPLTEADAIRAFKLRGGPMEPLAQIISNPQLLQNLTPQPNELLGEFGVKWRQSLELFAKDEDAWREFGEAMREFFDQAVQAGDVETARLAGQVYQLASRQRAALAQGNPLNFTDEELRLLRRFARYTDEGWYLMEEPSGATEKASEASSGRPFAQATSSASEAPAVEAAKRRGLLDDLSERVGLDKRSLLELLLIFLMMNRR